MIEFHLFKPTSLEAFSRVTELCPEDEYRVMDCRAFSGLIPNDLLAKTSDCLTMRTATPDGSFLVGLFNRIDSKATAIDQNVFTFATGRYDVVFSDHASWSARTIPLSATASPYRPNMPTAPSGYTKDLEEHYLNILGTAISGYRHTSG
jgi:hypothetical protein